MSEQTGTSCLSCTNFVNFVPSFKIIPLSRNIKYGAFAGLGTIAYFLIFYAVSSRLMLNSWVNWGSLVIYIVFMALACQQERSEIGRDYDFKQALRTAFSVYVAASILYYGFNYLMFNAIDPSLVELQRELVLENLERVSGVLGEENIEQMREQYEEESFEVTFSNTLFSFAWSLIGGFIISLALAGVMRRR